MIPDFRRPFIGFDIERIIVDSASGRCLPAIDVLPDRRRAVPLDSDSNGRSPVKMYHDGIVAECGGEPRFCIANFLDDVRAAKGLMGDPSIPEAYEHGAASIGIKHASVNLDIAPLDEIGIDHSKLHGGHLNSGCNVRFDAWDTPGPPVELPAPYPQILKDCGVFAGFHLHFGAFLGSGLKMASPPWFVCDEALVRRLRLAVVTLLPVYISHAGDNALQRLRITGIGRFRTPFYGLEWTDMGTMLADNLPLLAGIVGGARHMLFCMTDEEIDFAYKELDVDTAKDTILMGVEESRTLALAANSICADMCDHYDFSESHLRTTSPWSPDIAAGWIHSIAYGFPDVPWAPENQQHTMGLIESL